jgi:hypothetical protein
VISCRSLRSGSPESPPLPCASDDTENGVASRVATAPARERTPGGDSASTAQVATARSSGIAARASRSTASASWRTKIRWSPVAMRVARGSKVRPASESGGKTHATVSAASRKHGTTTAEVVADLLRDAHPRSPRRTNTRNHVNPIRGTDVPLTGQPRSGRTIGGWFGEADEGRPRAGLQAASRSPTR